MNTKEFKASVQRFVDDRLFKRNVFEKNVLFLKVHLI